MDDSRCRQFFAEASSTTYHRQDEALRAVFYEERSQKEVAEQFGYTYGSLRQLVHGFRKSVRDGLPTPFFESLVSADRRST
jgi:DNA-directed RNA polymerase specialized sigma24 family protein